MTIMITIISMIIITGRWHYCHFFRPILCRSPEFCISLQLNWLLHVRFASFIILIIITTINIIPFIIIVIIIIILIIIIINFPTTIWCPSRCVEGSNLSSPLPSQERLSKDNSITIIITIISFIRLYNLVNEKETIALQCKPLHWRWLALQKVWGYQGGKVISSLAWWQVSKSERKF